MFVCLSVSRSVNLSVCLFVCLFVCLCMTDFSCSVLLCAPPGWGWRIIFQDFCTYFARSVPDVIVKSFEDLYTQHPDLFEAVIHTSPRPDKIANHAQCDTTKQCSTQHVAFVFMTSATSDRDYNTHNPWVVQVQNPKCGEEARTTC